MAALNVMAGVAGRRLEWSVASRPLGGEVVCGDLSVVADLPRGVLVAVLDGLGHGAEAASAAECAAAYLRASPDTPLGELVRGCHRACRSTRGVVLSLAQVREAALTWIGVGNVEGVLVHAGGAREAGSSGSISQPAHERLFLTGGVVGHALPARLRPSELPLEPADLLVFATDGLRAGFTADVRSGEPPAELALRLLRQYASETDDALVFVGRYLGEPS